MRRCSSGLPLTETSPYSFEVRVLRRLSVILFVQGQLTHSSVPSANS